MNTVRRSRPVVPAIVVLLVLAVCLVGSVAFLIAEHIITWGTL